jgi:hypothetical protein
MIPSRTLSIVFMAALASPALLAEEQHVVPAEEFQRRTASVSESRRENLRKLERFIDAQRARDTRLNAILPPSRMAKAARLLSDEEVAQLAARAEKTQQDFAAGALSNEHLTYIVIALAAAVIVLIAT